MAASQLSPPDAAAIYLAVSTVLGVTEAECVYHATVVGQRKPRDLPEFKWLNTVLGNIKCSLGGAYRAFKFTRYASSYLAAYAYRFNRRFNLADLVVKLIVDLVRSPQVNEEKVRKAEHRFNPVTDCFSPHREPRPSRYCHYLAGPEPASGTVLCKGTRPESDK